MPQQPRLAEHPARACRLGLAGGAVELAGLGEVAFVGTEHEPVAATDAFKPVGGAAEMAPQPRQVALQGGLGGVGEILGPEGVEHVVGGDDASLGRGQQREHGPPLGPRYGDLVTVHDQPQRAEHIDPDLHLTIVPRRPCKCRARDIGDDAAMTRTDNTLRLAADAEQALVAELRSSLRGPVVGRDDAGYDEGRLVWNGLIDRYPAVIAQCRDVADVVEAVRIARRFRPVVSVRGGGHQVAGSGVCDNGLVIDLSAMAAVQVDATARIAHVQAGARWQDVDRATQVHGLATTGGEVSTTGVAGLTLGGGLGVLMRTHGLSCDNLRSVEIVTADGMVRTASRDEHTDLFWAARGGGRGLGVVTSFEFELHPLGPDVAGALVLYPYDDAASVIRAWRQVALDAPDTVAPELALWSIPPLPDVPEELHGQPVVFVAGTFVGPAQQAAPVLTPLRELGSPLADMSGIAPYVESQSAVDELFPDGGRYYWKSHMVDELSDELIDTLVGCDADRPSPESVIFIRTLGGAISRVGPDETAYPHRAARFNISIDGSWHDPGLDATAIGWVRSTWDRVVPFSTGGVYLNFAGFGDEADLGATALGHNDRRLADVRHAYDPDGVFAAAARRA